LAIGSIGVAAANQVTPHDFKHQHRGGVVTAIEAVGIDCPIEMLQGRVE
jgi:hypothetical protein